MTTLIMPSFERRLLRAVREELAAEPVRDWPPQSLQLCLDVLRRFREDVVDLRRALEGELTEGVEARSFAQTYGGFLPAAEDQAAFVLDLVDSLAQAGDVSSQSLSAELRLLEHETRTFRDLLAAALS